MWGVSAASVCFALLLLGCEVNGVKGNGVGAFVLGVLWCSGGVVGGIGAGGDYWLSGVSGLLSSSS